MRSLQPGPAAHVFCKRTLILGWPGSTVRAGCSLPGCYRTRLQTKQRAHWAPRFFGAGPLTWSSGPFHAFPFRPLGLDVLLPQLLRGIPRNPAASHVLLLQVPTASGMSHVLQAGSLPGRRVPRFTGPGPTGSLPGPECPTFTGRAPPTPFGLYKVTKDRGREDRACATCRRAHGRELKQVWVAL